MTPGTVLVNRHFVNNEQIEQHKYLVILTDGEKNLPYITVKTTSHQKNRGTRYGCQAHNRFPNFFLPLHATKFLKTETWVQLEHFEDLPKDFILKKIFDEEFYKLGIIDTKITIDLLECAMKCDDLREGQVGMIEESLRVLKLM